MKLLKVKLDYVKDNEDAIFYRYKVGNYIVFFDQYKDNGYNEESRNSIGCIFQVGIQPNKLTTFKGILPCIRIYCREGYPSEYIYESQISNYDMLDLKQLRKEISYAERVLLTLRDFFENSLHKELFEERKFLL